jgi:hypothetical protein
MKRRVRKTLKINQTNLLKHLKVIATHGIIEQGNEIAVQLGKEIFYYQRGNEKFNLSDQEVGKLLYN